MTDLGHLSPAIRHSDGPGDAAIAELAQRQHGRVAHRQLRALGLSGSAIHRRAQAGRLIRLYPGVYAVGHALPSACGNWMAAVLACGEGAVLSHRSAAALWNVLPSASARIDVTTGRGRGGHRGITLHRSRSLPPDHVAEVDGIGVTSIPRTLLDVAEVVSPRQLRRALDQSVKHELFDLRALERLLARSRGRRGAKPLAELLADRAMPEDSRLELERLLFELCRAAGLPLPAMNVTVAGFVVDAFWAGARLVVELDSYAWHRTREELERDSEQITALQLAGYRVLRFTWRQVTTQPERVAAAIRQALSQPAAVT
jgi:very-short-patch-repair endonuclease